MRFGLFGSATARHGGPDVDSGQGYKQFVEYNIEAEALGYHSTFLVEHHFTGFGQVSASLSLLTWVAAKTKTLRLGTAVLVLPWHSPVLLAEQAATIDLLSGGRLDFGVGKGYRHNEFAGFCVPIEEADGRFNESLDVIVKSWTSKQRFSHHGKYWNFEDIIVEPPTAQKPHPPIWMGAGSRIRSGKSPRGATISCSTSSPRSKRSLSASRSTRRRWKSAALTFDPHNVGVARAYFVAKDAADKDAALERRMEAQRRLEAISSAPAARRTRPASWPIPTPARRARKARFTARRTRSRVKLEKLRKLGVEYVLLNGGGPAHESLRRFAREVMPAFLDGSRMRVVG